MGTTVALIVVPTKMVPQMEILTVIASQTEVTVAQMEKMVALYQFTNVEMAQNLHVTEEKTDAIDVVLCLKTILGV